MPIDYKKYPANWKSEIRPTILKRANNCCENCGLKNHEIGYRDATGYFYGWQTIENLLEIKGYDIFCHELSNCYDKNGNPTKPLKIVLTVAHLDHDVTNNDPSNLKALCQKCHLSLDLKQHRENARKTIQNKKGLQSLF
jgi:hypothetical protein